MQNIYESLDSVGEEATEVKAKQQADSEKAEGSNGKMVELDIDEKNGNITRRPSYSQADTSAQRKQLKKLGTNSSVLSSPVHQQPFLKMIFFMQGSSLYMIEYNYRLLLL